jgi:hypothetical protein
MVGSVSQAVALAGNDQARQQEKTVRGPLRK